MAAANALFAPGRISYPPEAQRALRRARVQGIALLVRHLSGDWGEIDDKRQQVNHWAITHRCAHHRPVISRYRLPGGGQVMLITRRLHVRGQRQTTFSLVKNTPAKTHQSNLTQRSHKNAKRKNQKTTL
jgi:hypothetical protein